MDIHQLGIILFLSVIGNESKCFIFILYRYEDCQINIYIFIFFCAICKSWKNTDSVDIQS